MSTDNPERDTRGPLLYREYPPPSTLAPYVRCFWSLDRCAHERRVVEFSPAPDPYPGLVFQLGPDRAFHFDNHASMPQGFLFGQALSRKRMLLSERVAALGVFLRPGLIKPMFAIDASEVADECVDIDLLAGAGCGELSERLCVLPDVDSRLALLSRHLEALCRRRAPPPAFVDLAVGEILSSNGQTPVRDLVRRLELSQRTLERHFIAYIGVSPKRFSRVCRFHAALRRLRSHSGRLVDVAHELGYADQSHFIRDFRGFLGVEPGRVHYDDAGLFALQ